MDRNLALEVVRVTEAAALASARLMGRGDEAAVDHAAVEAMHQLFLDIDCKGHVVLGEGERDSVSMLYVEEESRSAGFEPVAEGRTTLTQRQRLAERRLAVAEAV